MNDQSTNVLFLNRHGAELIDYLKRGLGGLAVDLQLPPDEQRQSLLAMVPSADVLIGWGSDMELLQAATRCRLFINPGTGIKQHLENFRVMREVRPIVLANGHGNSYAVAQHAVALLLALANKVIPHHQKMVTQVPPANPQRTVYFKDIAIGLLGYGAINTKVHRLLSGFDVSFAALRRSWDAPGDQTPTALERFTTDQLDSFFEHCDVVVNALPDTQLTRNMVGMAQLERLGARGLFVNVGRASTLVQADLFEALSQRVLGGAAIEVWWPRGPKPPAGRHDPYDHPFHELDNIVMSPHRGADSGGDPRRWDEVIENLKRVHAGRTDFLNVVNLDLEY